MRDACKSQKEEIEFSKKHKYVFMMDLGKVG